MLDGFLCATRDEKGTVHFSMNKLRSEISGLIQQTIFMDANNKTEKFMKEGFTYRDVCVATVKEFKERNVSIVVRLGMLREVVSA